MYFNSRPSARGDLVAQQAQQTLQISIHAPPRGATCRYVRSIEAQCTFQFTPLREGRQVGESFNVRGETISIHAPPRGATGTAAGNPGGGTIFQFTPLREGRRDGHGARDGRGVGISIHAPPRGATKLLKETRGEVKYFNSRPSARGDELNSFAVHPTFISIHAPPRGATDYRVIRSGSATVFQFTPLREGRLAIIWRWMCLSYFNSRPSARGDGNVWAF